MSFVCICNLYVNLNYIPLNLCRVDVFIQEIAVKGVAKAHRPLFTRRVEMLKAEKGGRQRPRGDNGRAVGDGGGGEGDRPLK